MSNNTENTTAAGSPNTSDGELTDAAFATYAKGFFENPKAKAYVSEQGYTKTIHVTFATRILEAEGLVDAENLKAVRAILLAFGLGHNPSQTRQKLEGLTVIPKSGKVAAAGLDDL